MSINIYLRVRNRIIERTPYDRQNKVVANSINKITFTIKFDDEWDGLSKSVIFTNKKNSKELVITTNIETTPLAVPYEVLDAGWLFVSVVGYGDGGMEVLTTKRMEYWNAIRIYPSGETEGDIPYDPTPSVADQILASVGNAVIMAQSVKDDADAGKFTGSNFRILGRYDSLLELQTKVPNPDVGDVYEIGLSYPYTVMVFTYDESIGGTTWVDNGTISGADGQDGVDGQDGADGISVSSATINLNGNLILTLSNGVTIDCGLVKGSKGDDGADGVGGADGISITNATINSSGRLILTFSDSSSIDCGVVKGVDGTNGADGVDGKSLEFDLDGTLFGVRQEGGSFVYTNLKGDKGDTGSGFKVLGYYDNFGALQSAVTSPIVGDAYGVGTQEPYDIYIYDGVNNDWVNNGALQGAKGDQGVPGQPGQAGADGQAATIQVGTVTTGNPGTSATVTNSGTSSAAKFDFTLPRGSNGLSAYEVALINGFVGSESAWLASLKGADGQNGSQGPPGQDGVDGDDAVIYYGTCTNNSTVASKTVSIAGFSAEKLVAGVIVCVFFVNANVVANPTLNVSVTGAKSIRANNASSISGQILGGTISLFQYDGTYWIHLNPAPIEKLNKSGGTITGDLISNNPAVTTQAVRNIYAGTTDMTAGVTALTTGVIYFVYE